MAEVSIFITPTERWEKIVDIRDRFCDALTRNDEIDGVDLATFLLAFIKDSDGPIHQALTPEGTK
jgi:hypothetical protein